MVKFPKMTNPAGSASPLAPKLNKPLTAEEAEKALARSAVPLVTKNSELEPEENNDYEIDETDDPEDQEENTTEEEVEEAGDTSALVTVTRVPTKKGSNLSPQQQQHLDYIKSLGKNQGRGVASLINMAEEMVTIGHHGIFESKQVRDLYITFRKESNTAAGKNREFNEGQDDHTITAQTSKLRSFYKVGDKWGTDGWSKMLAVARDIHVSILRNKDERKNLRSKQLVPTYEALVKIASEQMKKEKDAKGIAHEKYPQLLNEAQIRDVFIDPNKVDVEPSVKDVIDAAAKAIERVINGKVDPVTGTYTRENFAVNPGIKKGEEVPDDLSTGYALGVSLVWMLNAGERFKTGYILNREKEIADAKVAAEERKRKHNERIAREEQERIANKERREKQKADTAAAKKLETEAKQAAAE